MGGVTPPRHAPRYLTPAEYAAEMRVSPQCVTRLCRLGRIEGAERVGRLWRIPNPDYQGEARNGQA